MSLKASATPNYFRRKFGDWIMRGATVICTLIAIVPLVLIIGYVLVVGGRSLNADFFTQAYQPPLTIDVGARPMALLHLPPTRSHPPPRRQATRLRRATAPPQTTRQALQRRLTRLRISM